MGFRRLFKEFSRWIDCFLLKEMNRVLMVCVANGLLLISNGQLLVSMYVTCIICMISCRWSACCFEVQWFVKGRVSGPHTTISWEGLLKRQKKIKGGKHHGEGKGGASQGTIWVNLRFWTSFFTSRILLIARISSCFSCFDIFTIIVCTFPR